MPAHDRATAQQRTGVNADCRDGGGGWWCSGLRRGRRKYPGQQRKRHGKQDDRREKPVSCSNAVCDVRRGMDVRPLRLKYTGRK